MPRHKVLNSQQRGELTAIPDEREMLLDHFTFTAQEVGWIKEQNGPVNHLGFALQLALMKFPGVVTPSDWRPSAGLVKYVAEQIEVPSGLFEQYPGRKQTLFDHRRRIQWLLRVDAYRDRSHRTAALKCVEDLSLRTDHGPTVVRALIEHFRKTRILLPSVAQLESIAAEAITHGERALHKLLNSSLRPEQTAELQWLLNRKRHGRYELTWLTESVEAPTTGNFASHIERLVFLRQFKLPRSLREKINPERLARIAEITSDTHLPSLRALKPDAQCAKLVAIVLEFEARITDELLTIFGKLIGGMYNDAKSRLEEKRKADQEALIEAGLLVVKLEPILRHGSDKRSLPYDEIQKVISWEDFARLATDIKARTKNHRLGPLPFVIHSFPKIHRCAKLLLQNIEFNAAPAVQGVLNAVNALQDFYDGKITAQSLPDTFVPHRWKPLVQAGGPEGLKYYELCALTRLNECLRSGDISVKTSHRFKDFEDYLVSIPKYNSMKASGTLPLAIVTDCEKYLEARLAALQAEIIRVEGLIKQGLLQDVTFSPAGRIKIARSEANTSLEAKALSELLYGMVPNGKITHIMQELDARFNFSRCFLDFRSGQDPLKKKILYTALLAKGLNLSCEKMAQACPDDKITKAAVELCNHWCLRPENYTSG